MYACTANGAESGIFRFVIGSLFPLYALVDIEGIDQFNLLEDFYIRKFRLKVCGAKGLSYSPLDGFHHFSASAGNELDGRNGKKVTV